MRAHYLQHAPFEGLGSIEAWLVYAGYAISSTRLFNNEKLPEVENLDLLVILGGPMSVNDEREYPWLVREKQFIKNVVRTGKPVLGICLGAQLIANAMGSNVFRHSAKEIGWFPIEAIQSERSVFQLPAAVIVFHWHSETFDLPTGAVQIAKSKACDQQAFQIGTHVIGLQFHLETTPALAQALVEHCEDELVEGEYIQSKTKILSTAQEQYSSINCLMGSVLEYLQTQSASPCLPANAVEMSPARPK